MKNTISSQSEAGFRLMRQYGIIKNPLIAFALVLNVLHPLTGEDRPSKAEQPNIVIILADDMGYSDLGCMGSEIETPNLDRMAEEGTLFTHFYNASVCCPSRASLLTGQWQWDAGMGGMSPSSSLFPEYQGYINDESVTIAEALKPYGYQTYMVGKWHLGNERRMWPDRRGFDQFYGTPAGGGLYFYPSKFYDRPVFLNGEKVLPKDGWYSTDGFTDHAIDFIENERKAGKPFFMYLAYIAPHYPLQAKEQDIEKYESRYSVGYERIRKDRFEKQLKLGIVSKETRPSPSVFPEWDSVEDKEQEAREMAVYAAMVDCMDQNIGRLLDTLENQGIEENTAIFFLSDNGAGRVDFNKTPDVEIGSGNSNATYGVWYNVSATPYRKGKRMEHEGGILTPMIVRWPKGIKGGGSIIREPAHINDFMATCLELAGGRYPETFGENRIDPHDGKSFLPLLSGKTQDDDRSFFWSFIGNEAIRQGDWKLVRVHEGDWELYKLSEDPTELNDLSAKYPEKLSELRQKFEAFAKEHGVRPWPLEG